MSHRVLVVDDDPDGRASVSALLTELNFEVVEAANGKEAIHYLTSNQPEPSLIVTDLHMPDMTGWEFITILQAYTRLSGLPVFVVSGHVLQSRPVRDDGVVEIFQKPLDADRFLAAVERHAVTAVEREARRKAAAKRLVSSPF